MIPTLCLRTYHRASDQRIQPEINYPERRLRPAFQRRFDQSGADGGRVQDDRRKGAENVRSLRREGHRPGGFRISRGVLPYAWMAMISGLAILKVGSKNGAILLITHRYTHAGDDQTGAEIKAYHKNTGAVSRTRSIKFLNPKY